MNVDKAVRWNGLTAKTAALGVAFIGLATTLTGCGPKTEATAPPTTNAAGGGGATTAGGAGTAGTTAAPANNSGEAQQYQQKQQQSPIPGGKAPNAR